MIPPYCLSPPTSAEVQPLASRAGNKHATKPPQTSTDVGAPVTVRVRLSTTGEDLNVNLPSAATIGDLKIKLCAEKNMQSQKITMLYAGRVLANSLVVGDLSIPKGYVIQAVLSL